MDIQQRDIQYIEIDGPTVRFRPDTPIEVWSPFMKGLLTMNNHMQFLIADGLIFGDITYGEEMYQVLSSLYSPKTIKNWISVAKSFPAERRRSSLTFSHHEALSALPDEVQDEILDEAEAHEYRAEKVRELKKEYEHKDFGEPEIAQTCPTCGGRGYLPERMIV